MLKLNRTIRLFFMIFITAAICLHPVEVKKIEVKTYADFQEGEFKGTSLGSDGKLSLGPEIKKIGGPALEYYLSLDISRQGDIYIGTGHKASVYRIKPDNTGEEIFASDFLDVHALLVTENGDIWVGTSPNGRVYKIESGKKYSVKNGSDIFEMKDEVPRSIKEEERKNIEIFNPDERFIWDIKEDKTGKIIFAVGNGGGVYEIDKTGNVANIFTPEDSHIISLYITKNNSILAGSGDRGIIYRIDNRKVKVLFDSPFDEVKGICEDKEGNIFFSAAKGLSDRDKQRDKSIEFEPVLKSTKKESEKIPLEKSVLYCLRSSGVVESVWKSKEEYIYSVAYDEKTDSVLVGTGNLGRVYRVTKDGDFAIIYESESAQVFKIVGKNSGFTIISNNTAALEKIEANLAGKGTYLSEVFDLEIQSRLGKIYWDASPGLGTGVMLYTRSGNSNIPDSTWSDWSAPFSDPENSTIGVPGTRYFQVKAALNISTNTAASPYLNNFRVFYVQDNLSPQIEKIEISKPAAQPQPASQPDKTESKTPPDRKYLTVKWEAKDPNGDRLKYNVFLQKAGADTWLPIKEDITDKTFEIERELFEDGKYLLKITADDFLANPPALAKSTTKISSSFIIDSTAPVVKNFSLLDKQVDFTVADDTSLIAKVFYSLDGKMWYPIFPKDLLNDSRSESYSFSIHADAARKNPGPVRIIFIKVIDEFNNYKVFQGSGAPGPK